MPRQYVMLVSATPVEAPVPGFPPRIAAIEFFDTGTSEERDVWRAIKMHPALKRCKVVLSSAAALASPRDAAWGSIGAEVVGKGMAPPSSPERLSATQLRVMRSLRGRGEIRFVWADSRAAAARALEKRGLAVIANGTVRLTDAGIERINAEIGEAS